MEPGGWFEATCSGRDGSLLGEDLWLGDFRFHRSRVGQGQGRPGGWLTRLGRPLRPRIRMDPGKRAGRAGCASHRPMQAEF